MHFTSLTQSNESNDFYSQTPCPSFINDEALSSELAGYFFLAIDRYDTALKYFLHAHEKYHNWGAVAKCNALFEFVQTTIDSTCITADFASLSYVHGASNDGNLPKNKRVL
jgi:hypothetical protein